MSIDLSNLDRAELAKLQTKIEKRLKALDADDRRAALKAAEKAARDHGFSLSELTGDKPARGAKSPAKYRDPETGKEWTGRGRRPEWIKKAGDDLSKFEI